MAEEVIISGVGNGPPDFATESTQKAVLAALGSIPGISPAEIDKLSKAIGKGDQSISDALRSLSLNNKKEQNETNKKLQKQIDSIEGLRDGEKKRHRESLETLQKMNTLFAATKKAMDEGQMGMFEGIATVLGGVGTVVGGVGAAVGKAIVALGTMANAANSFAIQIGEDRFNLANEIRQSGLASSLNATQSSMIGFADMVNQSSFTLGQAAEFTRQFNQAVGGLGVQRSMKLVQDLAFGFEDTAGMLQRFGMDFNQVKNVAGEYLESIRSMGQLDRMNDQQLRSGMMDFMDTVTVTSNILKINIEDAAKMVANTLSQRDDLTAMLATLPNDLRNNVQSVVAGLGAQNTQFGESIAQFVAAGGMQNFLTTDQGQAVAGSAFGQEFLPILEQIGNQILAGGDLGQILAGAEGQLSRLSSLAQDDGFAAMIRQNADPLVRELLSDVIRLQDNIGDANAGNRADTNRAGLEDDRAFVNRAMVEQERSRVLDNILTTVADQFDYADNLESLNAANLELIQSIEKTAVPVIDAIGDEIADATTFIQEGFTQLGTAATELAGKLSKVLPGDQGAAQAEIENGAAQRAASGNLNRTATERRAAVQRQIREAEAAAAAEAAVEAAEQERMRLEFAVGGNRTRTEASAGRITELFNGINGRGSEKNIEFLDGEYRMSLRQDAYIPVPAELAKRLLGQRTTRNNILRDFERMEGGFSYGSTNSLLEALTSADGIDTQRVSQLLGIGRADQLSGFDNETGTFSDQRFQQFDTIVNELAENNALTKAELESLVAALTTYNANFEKGALWWKEADTERNEAEKAEAARLVQAVNNLINALGSN